MLFTSSSRPQPLRRTTCVMNSASVMVEAATKLLERRGMRRIDIHADAFYTAAEMASANKKTGAER